MRSGGKNAIVHVHPAKGRPHQSDADIKPRLRFQTSGSDAAVSSGRYFGSGLTAGVYGTTSTGAAAAGAASACANRQGHTVNDGSASRGRTQVLGQRKHCLVRHGGGI